MSNPEGLVLSSAAQAVLDIVIPILVTALGSLLTIGLKRLNDYLRSKVHSASFQCASERIDKLVGDAVAEAEMTLVRELKTASKDGVLTRDEGLHIRDEVLGVVKRQLGTRGMQELKGCLGHDSLAAIEDLIRTRIESAVLSLKGSTPAPSPADAPTTKISPMPVRIPKSLSPDGPAKP